MIMRLILIVTFLFDWPQLDAGDVNGGDGFMKQL